MAGRRVGVAGNADGAAFTNYFVRNHLWRGGGWQSSALREEEVEQVFSAVIIAQGDDTVHKCVTNYLYIMEMAGFARGRTQVINTFVEEWVRPALFIAFDRYTINHSRGKSIDAPILISMAKAAELHKLMGTTGSFLNAVLPVVAEEYLEFRGRKREALAATATKDGERSASSHARFAENYALARASVWHDDDDSDIGAITRRLREKESQVRNTQNVRDLKLLYNKTCQFCGKKTIVGALCKSRTPMIL